MLKRNKLSIFLLAVVAMLTVYYVKTDKGVEIDTISNNHESSVRYYQETRDSINDARASLIMEYESIIASNTDVSLKQDALDNLENITTLTEKEIALEYQIINMGYDDALVEVVSKDKRISISILADEFSNDEFINIAVLALNTFNTSYVVDITNNILA